MPWRNGGGVTREYFRAGGDDFDWRLSMAQIDVSGPFSSFPMVDRILVLLSGAVGLRIDGFNVSLAQPLELVRFAGEADVDATVVAAPSTDLNLMWQRDRFEVVVEVRHVAVGDVLATGGVGVGFVALGECSFDDGDLEPGDAWSFTEACTVLAGDATVVLFELSPISAAGPVG